MTARDFVYWLQGYIEITSAEADAPNRGLTPSQMVQVRRHLEMVFVHDIDPKAGDAEHQAKLNALHGGAHQGGDVQARC